jgi:hypothetical protein
MNQPGSPAPRKGPSIITIILALIGGVTLLGLGTCALGAFWVTKKAESLLEGGAGGLVLESPADVKDALAGPKKDYVGYWVSERASRMAIAPDGKFALVKQEGSFNESFRGAISAFRGNDIELKAFVTIVIPVTELPHEVEGKWRMTAKGVTFFRESLDPSGAVEDDEDDAGADAGAATEAGTRAATDARRDAAPSKRISDAGK